MIRSTLLVLALAMFSTVGWTEEIRASKHESIGIGSGAALGGAVGGPIGLIAGAAVGAWLGARFNEEHTARVAFEQRWTQAEEEVAALNGLVETGERQVAALESQLRRESREMQSTVRDALDVQVLFKTDESTLPDATQERLLRLAELLARMDGMLVRIEGHADSRGDLEHNAQLSAQRAVSVRDTLIGAGVPANRITVDAHGETYSSAAENDVDALAMERRVNLTLIRGTEENRIAQK